MMGNAILRSLLVACMVFCTSHYVDGQELPTPLPMGETIRYHSEVLDEDRQINVYLPQDYYAQDSIRYSVIYVLDGGMDQDFLHIAGLVQYYALPWVQRVAPSIVVGIGGNHRRRDFTAPVSNLDFLASEGFSKDAFPAYGGADSFMKFLAEELQPFIRKQYRTNDHRTVIGESLAGLFAAEVLCRRPELFDDYLIMSPSLWWADRRLLRDADSLLRAGLQRPKRVYVGVPNKEEEIRMYQDAERFAQQLKAQSQITVLFDYLPNETHATILHQAVYNGLMQLHQQDKN